jgi:predicted ribosome quality control (RQC) complex YloA/Tae2 family protein
MKTFQFKNFICKLGLSAKENWSLLDLAEKQNIFFHLSSFPSGYVILEYDEEVNITMLKIAAQICKEGTKYRNLRDLKVDYCRCDNVEKGDNMGEIFYKSNRKVKQIKI